MKEQNGRRTFLRTIGLGLLTGAATTRGQESHGDVPRRVFRGLSKAGDIDEALRNAIAMAQRSVRHPDALVEWTLKQVSGRYGGISGANEVTVMIEATIG